MAQRGTNASGLYQIVLTRSGAMRVDISDFSRFQVRTSFNLKSETYESLGVAACRGSLLKN